VTFKDHFSSHSGDYSDYRPGYPAELFAYLASIAPARNKAWDCATGSGQSAVVLAEYFAEVVATDASAEQVSHAAPADNVNYKVALAEDSGIAADSVDLLTVAQALHWFRLDEFAAEARRVLKRNGILAAWTYNLLSVNKNIDELIYDMYRNVVYDYWDFDRQMVEEGYLNTRLPFTEVEPPFFEMSAQWNLEQLIGYLDTWSAVKACTIRTGHDPVAAIADDIASAWGAADELQTISWPLSVRVWRK
jgi:SAM-dependent methyltransferase